MNTGPVSHQARGRLPGPISGPEKNLTEGARSRDARRYLGRLATD